MTQIADSLSLTDEKQSTIVVASGYLALLLSCVAFGIMFTPLKRTNTGDGFFVQWVECATVFVIGLIINVIRGFPPFQWIAAIAGALFATGNVLAVPVVNGLSMATALLLWGTLQIVIGWSVSRFGVPGLLAPTEVKHNALNYIGIFITVASGVLFVFVENSNEKSERSSIEVERSEWKDSDTTCDSDTSDAANKGMRLRRKLLYVFMAMLVGISNGLMVAAIEVLKQQHPPILFYQVIDYAWSFFSTASVVSTIIFFLYCMIRRQKAYMNTGMVIPAVVYGALWSAGFVLWLISSDVLLQVIAYPIVTRLPAIISAVIDVVVYKSITGRNSLIILVLAIGVAFSGVVLIALSNQDF